MKTTENCPDCGSPIPQGAAGTLCIACILRDAAVPPPCEPAEAPKAGSTLRYVGDYELLEELGRGGMGIVYKARQATLNRTVAVKVLLGGRFASETAVARFQEEAEIVAALNHPNIVPIHEIGEQDGLCFYSMKWIDGASLAHPLTGKPGMHRNPEGASEQSTERQGSRSDLRSARDVARIVSQVARAVHFAHQHGVIHRDLSPDNVLVDREGNPWVSDFGLARLVDRARGLTPTRTLVGKPAYMAPEQSAPSGPTATTASDLFSLGVILYELLTGNLPFQADTDVATLEKVRIEEPRPPSKWVAELDRDLEVICLKCLSKDPAGRYGSGSELADDLDRWMRQEPILARPVSTIERAWKWARRHPWQAAFASTTAVSLIGPFSVAVSYVLLINYLRSHHPTNVSVTPSTFTATRA